MLVTRKSDGVRLRRSIGLSNDMGLQVTSRTLVCKRALVHSPEKLLLKKHLGK